jgi:GGDEF domain-containing protein
MPVATERDYLAELSSAVACYLRTLAAIGDCLAKACPETGNPYRKRIGQLRTRLSFEPTRESIKDSIETVEAELADYATVAAQYLDQHNLELRRGIIRLEDAIESMTGRQDSGASRLRELAARLETAGPANPVDASQAAAEIRRCLEDTSQESTSMVNRMRREIAAVEERLRGAENMDPVTGLLNAREMARQVEAYQASGLQCTLLRFELRGPVGDQVMRQAAQRLEKHFRHRDRLGLWNEREFLVLFHGPQTVAESRAPAVAQALAGRYDLDTGASVDITVHTGVTPPDAAAPQLTPPHPMPPPRAGLDTSFVLT